MKICTNELLLMGGMYQLLAFIFSWFNSEITFALGGMLYIVFWIAVLALSLALIPSWNFVYEINDRFPKTSVFLASIGWIPYFSVLYAIISYFIDMMTMQTDSLTAFLNNYMPVYEVFMATIILSLLYATYKVFYKKEDLEMTCLPVIR